MSFEVVASLLLNAAEIEADEAEMCWTFVWHTSIFALCVPESVCNFSYFVKVMHESVILTD